jgi:hypothetical protein
MRFLIEAARGVGMDRWQQLARVEMPLALSMICGWHPYRERLEALSLDGLGKLLLWGIDRRSRAIIAVALALFTGLYAYAGAALVLGARARDAVVVGSKTFTELHPGGAGLPAHSRPGAPAGAAQAITRVIRRL